MGTGLANPDLDAEKATHYEISYSNLINTSFNVKTNVFLSEYSDAIENVNVGGLSQNQNVGDFRHKGFELELNSYFDKFSSGLNYSYIDVEDKNNSGYIRTSLPKHSFFVYGKYDITKDLYIYANIKHDRDTYLQYRDNSYDKSNYTTVDTKISYNYKDMTFEAGIKNLFDETITMI